MRTITAIPAAAARTVIIIVTFVLSPVATLPVDTFVAVSVVAFGAGVLLLFDEVNVKKQADFCEIFVNLKTIGKKVFTAYDINNYGSKFCLAPVKVKTINFNYQDLTFNSPSVLDPSV